MARDTRNRGAGDPEGKRLRDDGLWRQKRCATWRSVWRKRFDGVAFSTKTQIASRWECSVNTGLIGLKG